MYTGHLCNPQPPFTTRGVPASYTTQQDYSYPSVPQLGVASQPRIAMTTPLQPLGGIETIFVMHNNDVNLILLYMTL